MLNPYPQRCATFEEVLPVHAIAPESVRPLERVEYEKLAKLGVFGEERVNPISRECSRPTKPGHPRSLH